MKTTVEISDTLLHRLKARAAKEHTTMRELIESALRQFLSPNGPRKSGFKLRDGSVNGNGLMPGIREGDWEQIADIIYEGRGGTGGYGQEQAPR